MLPEWVRLCWRVAFPSELDGPHKRSQGLRNISAEKNVNICCFTVMKDVNEQREGCVFVTRKREVLLFCAARLISVNACRPRQRLGTSRVCAKAMSFLEFTSKLR